MPTLNPWIIIGVIVAILFAGGYGYYIGGVNERNAIEAQTARDTELEKRVTDIALAVAAQEIAKLPKKFGTYKEVLEREIINHYDSNCVSTPDGLRAVNNALTNGKPFDTGGMPGPDSENGPVAGGSGP